MRIKERYKLCLLGLFETCWILENHPIYKLNQFDSVIVVYSDLRYINLDMTGD